MGGAARFGPDVEWLGNDDPAAIDYTVAADTADRVAPVIRAYWPRVTADMLAPGYAGVRPKLSAAGAANADFRIDGPSAHGLPGLVNLFGVESPGLTSSLAIADHVAGLVA
jgi:D-amino-acid oxidase